jgi:hypothetical protein
VTGPRCLQLTQLLKLALTAHFAHVVPRTALSMAFWLGYYRFLTKHVTLWSKSSSGAPAALALLIGKLGGRCFAMWIGSAGGMRIVSGRRGF